MTMQLISQEHIAALDQREQVNRRKEIEAREASIRRSWKFKEVWLAIFARCLSPSIACKQSQVSLTRYRRWRSTDASFCRAINRLLEHAQEDLVGSVYARATGYLKPDAETPSGYEEDGQGRPIRYGGSDRLALSLLDKSEQAANSTPVVQINIGAMVSKPDEVNLVVENPQLRGELIDCRKA